VPNLRNGELAAAREALAETETRAQKERTGRLQSQFVGTTARVIGDKHRSAAEVGGLYKLNPVDP
jgi:hypothetical protein